MDPTFPSWIADAWITGQNAAQKLTKKQLITRLSNIERPEEYSYDWWRAQGMLAQLGVREVSASAQSEEGREGDS